MKNIFIYTLFLLLAVSISAQEAAKYPLLEHFTNTRCPICGARNPDFHEARKSYGDDILHISYHPSAPYPNCVLHQHNPEGNSSRFDHYRPPGTPTVYLDGKIQSGSNMLRPSDVDAALQARTYFDLSVTHSLTNNELQAEVTITTRGEVPAGQSYQLYVAAVERKVEYDAPNGESTHYNVFRSFLSDRMGEPLSPAANGNSVSWSGNVALHPDWVEEEMYVLVFIENDTEEAIENAGASVNATTSTDQQARSADFSLFPNPTSDRVLISGGQVSQWAVYSITGTLISEGSGLHNRSVSLAGHPSGPYILRLQNRKGEWQTYRVIKE